MNELRFGMDRAEAVAVKGACKSSRGEGQREGLYCKERGRERQEQSFNTSNK